MKKDKLAYISSVLGASLLIFIFLSIAITSIVFLFGGSASWVWTILSIVGSVTFIGVLLSKMGYSEKHIIISIASFVLTVSATIGISSYFIDSSFDGNWYHKEAVGLLKEGWNPVYEASNAFTYMYVDAYPKASWVFAANIYSLTGNIESGKAYNLLLILAVFLVAYGYLTLRFDRNKALMMAGALALGTVAIAQLQTYYVDGALGSLVILLTLALSMVFDTKYRRSQLLPYLIIIASIVMVGNLKFTGLLYAGIIVFVYWVYAIVRKDWIRLKRITLSGIIGLLLALCIVGAPTYIKNTITYDSPFYPLIGDNSIDIMTSNQPLSYGEKSGIHKFLESNFGESMNITDEIKDGFVDSPLKIPFTIKLRELAEFSSGIPDVRQAGYGVWFGGILLLSVLAVGILIIYALKHRVAWHESALLLLPIIPVVLTALALQESWWARYLPQLIIVPVVLTAALFAIHKGRMVLPYVILFAIYVNIAVMATLYASFNFEYSEGVRKDVYSQINCTEGGQQSYIVHGMMALGSRYNVLDRCPGASFERAKKTSDAKIFWNDLIKKE